jgi:Ser/Thr protein kinase RdoA (MazF antagonist)
MRTSGSGLHNDFGPSNLVWREELPKGIIDYDNAAPGSRVDDLGYAAWKTQADVRKLRSLRRSGARLALAR